MITRALTVHELGHMAFALKVAGAEKVAVCIGNHDIDRNADRRGHTAKARKAFYNKLAKKFANNTAIDLCERAALCSLGEGLHCLMIDSTLGSGGQDCAGTLGTEECDKLAELVEKVPSDSLLVIGMHHPIDVFPKSLGPIGDENWYGKHVWSKGGCHGGAPV